MNPQSFQCVDEYSSLVPVVVGAGADVVVGVKDCELELSAPPKSTRSISEVCSAGAVVAVVVLDPLPWWPPS